MEENARQENARQAYKQTLTRKARRAPPGGQEEKREGKGEHK